MAQRLDKATWVKHLKNADSEGISLAEYARRKGLKVSRLYHWRRLATINDNRPRNLIKVVPTSTSDSKPKVVASARDPKLKTDSLHPPPQVTVNLFIFTGHAPSADFIRSLAAIGGSNAQS